MVGRILMFMRASLWSEFGGLGAYPQGKSCSQVEEQTQSCCKPLRALHQPMNVASLSKGSCSNDVRHDAPCHSPVQVGSLWVGSLP